MTWISTSSVAEVAATDVAGACAAAGPEKASRANASANAMARAVNIFLIADSKQEKEEFRFLRHHADLAVQCRASSPGEGSVRTNPDAVKYERITYIDVINQGLKIMDSTAITFCRDNKLPIVVFDVLKPGNIHRVLVGEHIGTLVD